MVQKERFEKQKGKGDAGSGGAMDFGTLVALGISLGAAMGVIFNHIPIGVSAGLLLATSINAYNEMQQSKPGARRALVVTLAALVLLAIITIFFS